MARLESITFAQIDNRMAPATASDNYTQVTGIYGPQGQMTPQFLNVPNSTQDSTAEILRAERDYVERRDLYFFRML